VNLDKWIFREVKFLKRGLQINEKDSEWKKIAYYKFVDELNTNEWKENV
jgi:hypothetical protein